MAYNMYGVDSENPIDKNPAKNGPIVQPIPNIVSYAPIAPPDSFLPILLRIMSKLRGKNMLNPKPKSNMILINHQKSPGIEDIARAIVILQIIKSKDIFVLFLKKFAQINVATRDIPKIKNITSISTSENALSCRYAGYTASMVPNDMVQKNNIEMISGNLSNLRMALNEKYMRLCLIYVIFLFGFMPNNIVDARINMDT